MSITAPAARHFLALSALFVTGADTVVSDAVRNEHGILVHQVESPFQAGQTQILVLVPERPAADRKSRVVYVLPVEPRGEDRFGDGLREIQKLGLHEKYGVVFAAPTFSNWPWYVDHPSDPAIRQEKYFRKIVVPFVESTYRVSPEPADRLLLGFSKSGWGAFGLLLRHPDEFGRALAWDAPLMLDRIGRFGDRDVIGTQENFERHAVSTLLRAAAGSPAFSAPAPPRLILAGWQMFHEQHQQAHRLLDELHVPHVYRDVPREKHTWGSGWLADAVDLLLETPPAATK